MLHHKIESRRNVEESKMRFLDFSTEIRYLIYELLFVDDQPIDLAPSHWNGHRCAKIRPVNGTTNKTRYAVHFFRVCKQIHFEATGVFYSQNTFQLTMVYRPSTAYRCLATEQELSDFSVLGWYCHPSVNPSYEYYDFLQHIGRTAVGWTYAMPTDIESRSNIESKTKAGLKRTQIYWPVERYRPLVKKLKIFLGLIMTAQSPSFKNKAGRMVEAGIRSLFDGILQEADVELHLHMPSDIIVNEMAQTQVSQLLRRWPTSYAIDTQNELRCRLIYLVTLGSAKTLTVTTNSDEQTYVTAKDCEDLKDFLKENSSCWEKNLPVQLIDHAMRYYQR